MHTEGSANLQSEYNFPPYPCTVFCVTSSSFYWASVANVANVLQPYWLIVLHLDVPDLTASSFYEVLAAKGGDVYEPSYFRMFQLSPLVVFKRS